ncbi:MAG: hypothetical protein IT535_09840 [Bauldia sp.]|nr:hypothetical protein [Bauldia sp.]
MKPAVILVGADKGGVGKTTVSRLLLEYLLAHEVPVRAFDTEWPRGTLKRFHPDITEIVNMSDTTDQMRVIDTLDDAPLANLLDVRAGQLGPILQALKRIGFLDAAREGEFAFLLFHILGSSISSLQEIGETAPLATDAHYFLVKNFIGENTFFDWDPGTYRTFFSRARDATEIVIPRLDPLAYEQVDHAGVPFSRFVEDRTNSFVLRGSVRTWLNTVWGELDQAKTLRLIGARAPSRRGKR